MLRGSGAASSTVLIQVTHLSSGDRAVQRFRRNFVAVVIGATHGKVEWLHQPAPPTPAPTERRVGISARVYEPDALEVPAGTTVTWSSDDDVLHPVWFDDATERGWIRVGETLERTFGRAGEYPYHCIIHPVSMRGTVTVTAGPA